MTNLAPIPVWKRALAFTLRAITGVGLLFICFEIGVWLHPPLLAWGLGAIDRNLICTSAEAFRGALRDIGVADDVVHFELFEAGHMGIDYRYPLSLAWLCGRMNP